MSFLKQFSMKKKAQGNFGDTALDVETIIADVESIINDFYRIAQSTELPGGLSKVIQSFFEETMSWTRKATRAIKDIKKEWDRWE